MKGGVVSVDLGAEKATVCSTNLAGVLAGLESSFSVPFMLSLIDKSEGYAFSKGTGRTYMLGASEVVVIESVAWRCKDCLL
jgi:hypothetical protein